MTASSHSSFDRLQSRYRKQTRNYKISNTRINTCSERYLNFTQRPAPRNSFWLVRSVVTWPFREPISIEITINGSVSQSASSKVIRWSLVGQSESSKVIRWYFLSQSAWPEITTRGRLQMRLTRCSLSPFSLIFVWFVKYDIIIYNVDKTQWWWIQNFRKGVSAVGTS